uniref:Uncharacterized protein n=1 Tax=Arundo donax TaxID=35708 RepID=A0A0A9ACE2_ARUDO
MIAKLKRNANITAKATCTTATTQRKS